jgi:hypothetical protein
MDGIPAHIDRPIGVFSFDSAFGHSAAAVGSGAPTRSARVALPGAVNIV